MSIDFLRLLQRLLLLQLRDPFPDERPAEIHKKLRVVAREIGRLTYP